MQVRKTMERPRERRGNAETEGKNCQSKKLNAKVKSSLQIPAGAILKVPIIRDVLLFYASSILSCAHNVWVDSTWDLTAVFTNEGSLEELYE